MGSSEMYDKYISTFRRFTTVVCLTFSIFSINVGSVIVHNLGINLPGQILFGIYLIAQIGELISCPAYVILYAFNSTRFKELKNILCFKDRTSIAIDNDDDIDRPTNTWDMTINENEDMIMMGNY